MNNLIDAKTGLSLNGSGFSFTFDRFCNPNSAILLNNTYLQAPPAVYFSGDFTVIAWMNLRVLATRIIDFGNGSPSDNVFFSFNNNQNLFAGIHYTRVSDNSYTNSNSTFLKTNKWFHVAFVLNGKTGTIYVNGVVQGTESNMNVPRNVTRTLSFIGKSNWPNNPLANAVFDDLKIYNVALSADLIQRDYNTSSNNGLFKV